MITEETRPPADCEAKRNAMSVILEQAAARNGGGRAWRHWKQKSSEALIELVLRSPRAELRELSFEGDLQAVLEIRCPVPRWPDERGRLVIGDRVVCHLLYQDQWRFEAPPGWGPVGILLPHDVFHSNSVPNFRGACAWATCRPTPSRSSSSSRPMTP